jgi:hypothetical protein
MPTYNDPFYFALPRGARRKHVAEARAHIAATFDLHGQPKLVRVEESFALFRIEASA